MRLRKNERGFILLLTFAFLIVLVELTAAMAILISGETLDIGAQNDDKRLLYLADAGVERALREIRNDSTSSGHQTGVAHIHGAAPANSGASNTNFRYAEDGNSVLDDSGDFVTLKTFDSNYANSRITKVELMVRASRSSGGTAPTLQVSYATDGVFPQAGNTSFTLTSSSTPDLDTSLEDHAKDISSDRSWTWATILGADFTLRAERSGGNRSIQLDQLYLRVTYEIDTETEAWFTGSYQTYPLSLGAGTIQSVSIDDEQGKVHLNTASQVLLNNLFLELGISSGTASTLSTNIVSYIGIKPFDSVEELQKVTGMTSVTYDLIKDYVTVYSFINTDAYSNNNTEDPRTTKVNRAPININTASQQVLEAIFDDSNLSLAAGNAATLAADIITRRNTAPFTCFYSSDTSVTTDFYRFIDDQETFITNARRNRILDNADPSALIPVEGFAGYTANTGTEFCFSSSAYKVESVADVSGRDVRVKTVIADQGANTFTTFAADTTSTGYRKENFE